MNRERRALARRGRHRDAATVRLGDALDEAQAQAVAVNLPLERIAAAVERLEDVREIVRLDAAARDR